MKRQIKLGDRTLTYDLQRKKVKNVNLRIKRDLTVTVSASSRVTVEFIEDFMRQKAEFILRALEKYESLEKEKATHSFTDGDRFAIFGVFLPLTVTEGLQNTAALTDGEIRLTVRDASDLALKQKVLQKLFDQLCLEKVLALCKTAYPSFERLGVKYPEIRFRHMKSRWGSCSPQKGVLTFNYALAHAPTSCIEYVVYHEFTHFLHPDHSPAFYKTLSVYVPDYKERKKRLDQTPINK
ncbi:MAG: M48 family metallopeptidase [Clostridia bacterium]|nr:M48 family metallopeptidase [Clostridia bacterium]